MNPPEQSPRTPLLVGAVAVLSVAACLAGGLGWPLPDRILSGWQVANVAPTLLALVVGTAAICLAVAYLLVRPMSLGSATAITTWVLLAVSSAFALVWNDLYFAALASGDGGAIIPVFDWMFTFVPALVVGLVTRRHGWATHLRATLGTAIVTVPLLALGWAITGEGGDVPGALIDGLYPAVVFGVVPLLLAILLTRGPRTEAPALAAY